MPDGLLVAVTKAIIWRLHTAGVAYSTELGAADPLLPMLTVKIQPPSPDRIIAVTAYSRTASPNPKFVDRSVSVQLWIRGLAAGPGVNPEDAIFDPDRITSRAFDALHGQHHVTWNGLQIDRCAHSYGSPMGPDDQQHWEWSENYTVVLQQRSTP